MDTFKKFLLQEKIDNFFLDDTEQREKFIDQVWNIIQASYAKIGGVKGNGLNTKEQMINQIPMWKIYRKGNMVKIVVFYKDKNGRKGVLTATDGSAEAKEYLKKIIKDEFKTERSWKEVSHSMLRFIKTLYSEQELNDIAIPVETVVELLPDDIIVPTGKYTYTRNIGGEEIEKMALGSPYKTIKDKTIQ
jgi:hypothetical protein